jgi:hypothetical protein
MGFKVVEFETQIWAEAIASFLVGFAKLSIGCNAEWVSSLGSGTLVTISGRHGILTAAHVLDALPSAGELGLVQFQKTPERYQRLTVQMEHTDSVKFSGGNGRPDIGFLKLPPKTIEALNTNGVFYNLDKRRENVLIGNEPSQNIAVAAIGVVAELTKEIGTDNCKERLTRFGGLFADGELHGLPEDEGFDYVKLIPLNRTEFPMPENFGGMSGGGLWKIYIEMVEGKPKAIDKRLIGIPFFQEHEGENPLSIICHGQLSIYSRLFDEVLKRWPN